LWKLPVTWEKQETTNGDTASRASLASRVRSQQKHSIKAEEARKKWLAVHPACDCWWRLYSNGEEEMPVLGMRWTLGGQVGIDLPGVVDEESLKRLGTRFGVLLDKPPEGIPSRLSGGRHRLAILDLEFSRELLEVPSEDPEENPREPGGNG
jgi:hypothetical protein